MKIVVIGGSGLIGSKLVPKLREQGHEAVAASPNSGVNTLTGEGLAEVLKGASVVVDVSNSPSWEDNAVMKFFETSTRNILGYEAAAGVGHHVALSVVGSERLLESGYFRAKIAQENLIKSSSIPYSIVRATQFFEFIKGIADLSTEGNTIRLPSALIQPMAADDVASALSRVALGAPLNGAVEIGGPEKFHLDELVRRALVARNDPREVVADPEARYYGIKVSETTLIPGSDARLGETRLETWLSQSTNQIPAKTRQANAEALSKFAEAVNTANYELFSDVVANDCVDHDPGPGQVPGPDGYKALFTEMRQAFPDMKVEVADLVADDEAIAFAYTFTGTQDGPLMGIAPTGKKVKIRGLQISKFRDGKMVERWGSSDQLGMLQQIGAGAIPRP